MARKNFRQLCWCI